MPLRASSVSSGRPSAAQSESTGTRQWFTTTYRAELARRAARTSVEISRANQENDSEGVVAQREEMRPERPVGLVAGFKNFLMQGDIIIIAIGLVIALAFST